jgi:hypothetical protein
MTTIKAFFLSLISDLRYIFRLFRSTEDKVPVTEDPEQRLRDLRRELEQLTRQWVNSTFNSIPLDVAELAHREFGDGEPFYIEGVNFDLDDDGERAEALAYCLDEGYEFDADTFDSEIEDAIQEIRDGIYPYWGTVFHCDGIDKDLARAAGFLPFECEGIGTCLGVAGCGYSFYGQHWIPLWLSLPWNDEARERFEGLDYSML